jgi:hypothetical protein
MGAPPAPPPSPRAARIAGHAAVTLRREPAAGPLLPGEPPDLVALYAVTDGIEIADGTRILGRGEIAAATAWLKDDKSLEWSPDLWVIGERDDQVIVRDLDPSAARAGGGVLEAPTDGLSTPARAALDVISYLEDRLGIARSGSPERDAREAVARRDASAIAAAIARGFYPGAERELAHAVLALGALHAAAGDTEGALAAFSQAVAARARAAPRGAEAAETSAAWRTCAVAADKAGAPAVAELCRARA